MRVMSLSQSRFAQTCRDLAQVVAASGFVPDLVVGIKTGGEYVALSMLPEFHGARYEAVELHRPSTSRKRWVRHLAFLPTWMLDAMRMAEAWLLHAHSRKREISSVALQPDTEARRVLVVDDAVDSGITLKSVLHSVAQAMPQAQVRSAVITVTTQDPAVVPDYAILREQTLVRFPWSLDAK